MKPEDRLIIAIDTADIADILSAVDELGAYAGTFKIGSNAYSALGPEVVLAINKLGKKVFVDLKLFDIPEQVAGAARALTKLGAAMITVHALGGPAMMSAAKQAAVSQAKALGVKPPIVLGVTILTSLGDDWLKRLGMPGTDSIVPALALAAQEAGLDGIVAAARETAEVKNACGGAFLVVAPGIRLPESATDDQVRISAPDTAIKNGADYLVVGRPIMAARDPKKAAEEMLRLIGEVARQNAGG